MTGKVARPSWPEQGVRLSPIRAAALAAALCCGVVTAQPASPGAATKPGVASGAGGAPAALANSSLDTLLFYQLLIGELELNAGRAGNAFGVILDAARRNGDEALYQRAVEIALQARAGDQALEAARAWRNAKPGAVAPLRYQAQILVALKIGRAHV